MNALVVIAAAVAVCSGAQVPLYPGLLPWYGTGMPLMAEEPIKLETMAPVPMAYNMAPLASMAPIHSQYNSRDEFGQYSFGFTGGFNARAEMRDAFGNVAGSYNYLDSEGKVQTTHYVADALGFRVKGTNLPEALDAAAVPAPVYAEDVAAARADHMAAHEAAAEPAALPEAKYIDYAEDVASARADHMAAHEAAAAPAALPEAKYIDYAEDVAIARAEHMAAHEAAAALVAEVPVEAPVETPAEVVPAEAEASE